MGDRYDLFRSPFDLLDDDDDGEHFGHNRDDDDYRHDPKRRHEARIRRAVERDLLKLERTDHGDEFMHLAEAVLGRDAFGLGVVAGIVHKLGKDVASFYDLARVFVLADIYDRFCTTSGAMVCRGDSGHAWSRRLHLVRLGPWEGPFHLFVEIERAANQRDAIVRELKSVMDDPAAFLAVLPQRMLDAYGPKWKRFSSLRDDPRLSSQFEAGLVFGELLADLIMLLAGLVATIYGVVAMVDGAMQLAAKLPTLARFARSIRARVPRMGRIGESFETSAPRGSATAGETTAAGDRAAASVPREPPTPGSVEPRASAPAPPRVQAQDKPSAVTTTAPPLTKAEGHIMLREAVSYLKKMPPETREAQFRIYREDIKTATNGQWSAKHWPLTKNGSVYAGEGGEALVFDDAGNMYRGQLSNELAFARTREGLVMDYSKLKPL